MFVRFRQTRRKLQISLVETHRIDGAVRHEHVAGLGSVGTPLTAAGRITFWTQLHPRLAALGNGIAGKQHGAVLTAIHARIPMHTQDDLRAVGIANAKQDAEVWGAILSDMQAEAIENSKGLVSAMQRSIAERKMIAANAAAQAKAAQERLGRVERGEEVGSIGEAVPHKDRLAALGGSQALSARLSVWPRSPSLTVRGRN